MKITLTAFVFLSAMVGFLTGAHAQWNPDGVVVSQVSHDQWNQGRFFAPKTGGGFFIAWNDAREIEGSGLTKVYLQNFAVTGVPLWAENGVPVCAFASEQDSPCIVSDDAGGVYVAWHDIRQFNSRVYIQHLDASGELLWLAAGVPVADEAWNPRIAKDGAGGAIVAWTDDRNGFSFVTHAQRYNGDGVAQWIPGGVEATTSTNDQSTQLQIISDEAGGAIIAWEQFDDDMNVYTQRLDPSGARLWGDAGVALHGAGYDVEPQLVTDGATGAIVTWYDYDTGRVYAQRVSGPGATQWTSGGVVVCTGLAKVPDLTTDNAGGAIIAWVDLREIGSMWSTRCHIYAQRVSNAGIGQWTTNGVRVFCDDAAVDFFHVVSDGEHGGIVSFPARESNNGVARAQRVDGLGALRWDPSGIVVCPASPQVGLSDLIPDQVGGAIVAWHDGRNNMTLNDVYVTVVNANTSAGSYVNVTPVDVTDGSRPVDILFENTESGSTHLASSTDGPALPGTFTAGDGKYYHVSTTATHSGSIELCVHYDETSIAVPEANLKLLHWDTALPTPAWVDITTFVDTTHNWVCGETDHLSPFTLAASTATAIGKRAPSFALYQNVPNPFNPATTIGFSIAEAGRVRLQIFDAAGALVRTLVDKDIPVGAHTAAWDGRTDDNRVVSSGVYFYRLVAKNYSQTRKMILLK